MIEKNLYIVGMGPGDPGLITINAINALIRSDFIFYPEVYGGKHKIAYGIIKNAVKFAGISNLDEEKLIPLEIEMKRSTGRNDGLYKNNASKILDKLSSGADCSYVTLGDPMFYSTYWGLYASIRESLKSDKSIKITVINGVSSFHYSLGLIGEPYAVKNSSVLISVPVKKDFDEIKKDIKFIADKSSRPQVIVFMKAGDYVKTILKAFKELCGNEPYEQRPKLYLIEKSVLIGDFTERKDLNFDYFSIFIGVFL